MTLSPAETYSTLGYRAGQAVYALKSPHLGVAFLTSPLSFTFPLGLRTSRSRSGSAGAGRFALPRSVYFNVLFTDRIRDGLTLDILCLASSDRPRCHPLLLNDRLLAPGLKLNFLFGKIGALTRTHLLGGYPF